MQRRVFLAGAGCALALGARSAAAAPPGRFRDPENGNWGEALTASDTRGALTGLSPSALLGTPLGVKNAASASAGAVILTNLPTVSAQGVPGHLGSPGSCEAQSFGYCLGAYTAARNPDGSVKWSAADAANQPSAAWLYQFEHHVDEHDARVCPQGSGAKQYLDRLVSDGAPSAAEIPYNPHDVTTVSAECGYIKAIDVAASGTNPRHLTIGSYKIFANIVNGKATYLSQFKELIRHGHAIAFTGKVAKKYGVESPQLTNDAFTAPNGFNPKSGHGQVIVGFDDAKGPHGAFLVQNSFGSGWNPGPASDPGRNGRIWWDYDAFFVTQHYAAIAFPHVETLPMTGAVTLQPNDPGAPHFAIAGASLHEERAAHHLVLVTHASDALTITGLQVRGRKGRVTSAALNETTRFGYQYVSRRGKPFGPGTYQVRYAARTRAGKPVTYTGSVTVAAR